MPGSAQTIQIVLDFITDPEFRVLWPHLASSGELRSPSNIPRSESLRVGTPRRAFETGGVAFGRIPLRSRPIRFDFDGPLLARGVAPVAGPRSVRRPLNELTFDW